MIIGQGPSILKVRVVKVRCEDCNNTFDNILLYHKSSKKRFCPACLKIHYTEKFGNNHVNRKEYFKEYRRERKRKLLLACVE